MTALSTVLIRENLNRHHKLLFYGVLTWSQLYKKCCILISWRMPVGFSTFSVYFFPNIFLGVGAGGGASTCRSATGKAESSWIPTACNHRKRWKNWIRQRSQIFRSTKNGFKFCHRSPLESRTMFVQLVFQSVLIHTSWNVHIFKHTRLSAELWWRASVINFKKRTPFGKSLDFLGSSSKAVFNVKSSKSDHTT